MRTNEQKNTSYIIRLIANRNGNTYRVEEKLFLSIKKQLEPYRSYQVKPRQVRCIETGVIFDNAGKANKWLIEIGKTTNVQGGFYVKEVCKKRKETAYGYHFEYV